MFNVFAILAMLCSLSRPYIKEAHRVTSPTCDDPLGCFQEELTLVNPSFKQALVTINCSSEFDEQEILLYPRTSLQVTIELTIPPQSEAPVCKLSKWRYK